MKTKLLKFLCGLRAKHYVGQTREINPYFLCETN